MSQTTGKYLKFGSAIAVIVLALTYLAYTGIKESQSYYVTIKELRDMGDGAYSKHLRVSGKVKTGTIKQSGTNAQFVLLENGLELPVTYKGSEPPPDTFKDESLALAIGDLGKDGVFHANQLQAKCASKYVAQENASQSSQAPAAQPPAGQMPAKSY